MTIPTQQAGKPIPITVQDALRAALIVAAGLLVFYPVLHGGWLMDDQFYIGRNPLRDDPWRLWKIWFEPGSFIEYYPIEQTVRWVQWELWQDDVLGYHLTNVALHLTGALLVWKLLGKFGLRRAWLGGLIFAIHPVAVESVAWMAEQKNTLSLPPYLLAMCFFIDYEEKGRARDYWLALLFFVVAMLCKISMSPFPLIMLLYAWWKRGRIGWGDVKAMAPFLAVSLVLGMATVMAGIWYLQVHPDPAVALPMGGVASRFAVAGMSLAFYFSKCVLPAGLLFIYPQWVVNPPALWEFLPLVVMAGVAAWLWTKRRSYGRHLILGLGFFVLSLGPFIGFHDITFMSFTWVMDHLLYIPLVGVIGLAVAFGEGMERRLAAEMRPVWAVAVAAVLVALAWGSHVYAGAFTDAETLWKYTLERNPGAWIAWNNLGLIDEEKGRLVDAVAEYQAALRIDPDLAETHINLGTVYDSMGRYDLAIAEDEAALRIVPGDAAAETNWGNELAAMGDISGAIGHYTKALTFDSHSPQAHSHLGVALMATGRDHVAEAIGQERAAVQFWPGYAEGHYNLGIALGETGQMREAVVEFEAAARLNPADTQTRFNLAVALAQVGRIREAIEQFQAVVRMNPRSAEAAESLQRLKGMVP